MTERNIHNRSDWKDLRNSIRLVKGGNNSTQSINLSQPHTTTQQHIYIPSQKSSALYGNVLQKGLPLPTIISVSNEGESLIRNPSHLNKSIPQFSYVSPIGIVTDPNKVMPI